MLRIVNFIKITTKGYSSEESSISAEEKQVLNAVSSIKLTVLQILNIRTATSVFIAINRPVR